MHNEVPDCDLVVTVIAAKGNVVRLGISAPEDLDVYREEVWLRVCQEESPPSVIPLGQRSEEPSPPALQPSPLERKERVMGAEAEYASPDKRVISIKPKGAFP